MLYVDMMSHVQDVSGWYSHKIDYRGQTKIYATPAHHQPNGLRQGQLRQCFSDWDG